MPHYNYSRIMDLSEYEIRPITIVKVTLDTIGHTRNDKKINLRAHDEIRIPKNASLVDFQNSIWKSMQYLVRSVREQYNVWTDADLSDFKFWVT